MANLLSPLRYPGGKGALGKFLADVIVTNNLRGGTYYELYAGGAGAALYLLLNNVVDNIVINDADFRIFSFWDSILNQTDRFIEKMHDCNLSIQEWHEYKRIYENATNEDAFNIGFATFYLNRTNRSGILHNSGPIGGYNQTGNYLMDVRFHKTNLQSRIEQIVNRADSIAIHNQTAEAFIQNLNADTLNNELAFIYLDPPYYKKGRKLYLNNYCHDEHCNLARLLQEHGNINWIVSYDNAPEIIQMYEGFRMSTFNLKYSLQEKRQGSELMIFSDLIVIPENMRIGKNTSPLLLLENQPVNE